MRVQDKAGSYWMTVKSTGGLERLVAQISQIDFQFLNQATSPVLSQNRLQVQKNLSYK